MEENCTYSRDFNGNRLPFLFSQPSYTLIKLPSQVMYALKEYGVFEIGFCIHSTLYNVYDVLTNSVRITCFEIHIGPCIASMASSILSRKTSLLILVYASFSVIKSNSGNLIDPGYVPLHMKSTSYSFKSFSTLGSLEPFPFQENKKNSHQFKKKKSERDTLSAVMAVEFLSLTLCGLF